MKLECARFGLYIDSLISLVLKTLVPHRCRHMFLLPSLNNIFSSLKVCKNIRISFFFAGGNRMRTLSPPKTLLWGLILLVGYFQRSSQAADSGANPYAPVPPPRSYAPERVACPANLSVSTPSTYPVRKSLLLKAQQDNTRPNYSASSPSTTVAHKSGRAGICHIESGQIT